MEVLESTCTMLRKKYHEFYIFRWVSAVAQIDFFIGIGFIKMSITAFNMRLTGLSSERWTHAHWTFFGLIVCYTIVAFFLNVFTCNPVSAGYNAVAAGKLSEGFKCMPIILLGTVLRSINITMDYCLLAVPIIVLWRVQMDWFRKAKLFAVFSVGALACIGSAMTLISKNKLKSDVLYNYTTLLAWTLVELTLGVMTASLPILSALLPKFPSFSHSPSSEPHTDPNTGSRSHWWLSPQRVWQTLHSKNDEEGFTLRQLTKVGSVSPSLDPGESSSSRLPR